MEVKYFSASKLTNFLRTIKPGMLDIFGELRPLALTTDIDELKMDFNCGLRLQIPEGNWHVKILDADSEVTCFDEDVSDVVLISLEKFFVRWEFIIWFNGELIARHRYDPQNRRVHFFYQPSGMGDRIALFPYMEAFRKKWNCKVSCTVEPYLQELVRLYFPQIECCEPPTDSYATYYPAPGLSPLFTPEEFRKVPMEKFGEQIFGLRAKRVIYHSTKPRQIVEPYVCIAAQASITPKTWLNPDGWPKVIEYLKQLGYRVLCIDKNRKETGYGMTVKMPEGAEDFTGDLPLSERVNLLAYADFFIGMPSGLSWLAWAADVPVILISGITAPWLEFDTPYRVVNRLVCFGCHNDVKSKWPDFENCPRHKGTARAYECSKKISARQVINKIDELISDLYGRRDDYSRN